MIDRARIRSRIRKQRRALPPKQQREHAWLTSRCIASTPWFTRSRNLALYLAVNGELDPAPLMDLAVRAGKSVHLPVLLPYRHNRLWFAPYRPDTPLAPNRFGILEPQVSVREMLNPRALDLVIVPLVAFDDHCNRLGMGGGYYDRTFSFLTRRSHWQKPRLLGAAYEFQRAERLEHQPWDVPLAGVATEARLYLPPQSTA
jgi:5-formyltetrahydrofolate cyclo-ligase